MKYFLDTEFHEDGTTIDLISIGIVREDGREFYAVSSDAQLHRVHPWIRDNVLPHLPKYGHPAWMSRATIADKLRAFVEPQSVGKPEFWAYYADYDWVAICQLFGKMIDLPDHWPKYCLDLKQLSVDLDSPPHPDKPTNEHDALVDARWNRELYTYLMATKRQRAADATGRLGTF